MAQRISCSIWLPYGLVLILLIFCTVTFMITPTESSSAVPLIRPRTDSNTSNGNESSISDADVQKRIQEVFNRKGYSNPDPSPNDSHEAQPDHVAVRIDGASTRRRKRPLWKIDENFDPRKSYVIKHPNGTITYVPPKDVDLSGTVSTGSTAASTQGKPNELIDKMSEASTSDSDKLRSSRFVFPNDLEPRIDRRECTPDYPVCSNVIDYPQELINEIVGQQKERYAEVFGNDVVLTDGDKLVQRFDVDENGNSFEFICESRERLIHPRSGFNAANKSIMIVNTNDYMQGVRIETCSNTKNYPHELIDALVVQQGFAGEFDSYPEEKEDDSFTIQNRIGFEDNFEGICESKTQPEYPEEGYTLNYKLVKIVNTNIHKQRVDTERCRHKNSSCLECESQFRRTECRDISRETTLYALNLTSLQIYKEKIMIPSCCKCMVVRFKGFK